MPTLGLCMQEDKHSVPTLGLCMQEDKRSVTDTWFTYRGKHVFGSEVSECVHLVVYHALMLKIVQA